MANGNRWRCVAVVTDQHAKIDRFTSHVELCSITREALVVYHEDIARNVTKSWLDDRLIPAHFSFNHPRSSLFTNRVCNSKISAMSSATHDMSRSNIPRVWKSNPWGIIKSADSASRSNARRKSKTWLILLRRCGLAHWADVYHHVNPSIDHLISSIFPPAQSYGLFGMTWKYVSSALGMDTHEWSSRVQFDMRSSRFHEVEQLICHSKLIVAIWSNRFE